MTHDEEWNLRCARAEAEAKYLVGVARAKYPHLHELQHPRKLLDKLYGPLIALAVAIPLWLSFWLKH